MAEEMTAQEIKGIRNRYGLSQKAFARLLGLGDASIVRYENGQRPTRANANLIRAAAIPEFMAGCLERDGAELSEAQRRSVEKVVYAEVSLGEEGEMGINEVYELTLQQEVLNEKAAAVMAELISGQIEAERAGDAALVMVYEDMLTQLALLKPTIATPEARDAKRLSAIEGKLDIVRSLCLQSLKRAA